MTLTDDPGYFRKIHNRWMTLRNRVQELENYRDEFYSEQCLNCTFWVPLTGLFHSDYGGCTNEASPFDKEVMFEHDGCEAFEPAPR